MVLLRAFAWDLLFFGCCCFLQLHFPARLDAIYRSCDGILRADRRDKHFGWMKLRISFLISLSLSFRFIGELHFDYATVFCSMSSNGHHSIEYTLSVYTYVYLYTSTPHSTTETDQNGRSISSTLSSFFPDPAAACCSLITSRINATSAATYCF